MTKPVLSLTPLILSVEERETDEERLAREKPNPIRLHQLKLNLIFGSKNFICSCSNQKD